MSPECLKLDLEKIEKAVEAMNNTVGTITDGKPFSYKLVLEKDGKQRVFITLTLPHVGSIIEKEVILDENSNFI